MKRLEILFGLLRIPVDFMMAVAAFLLSYQIRSSTNLIPGLRLPLDLASFPAIETYRVISFKASLILLVLFAFNKMYSLKSTTKISRELRQILVIVSASLMTVIAYFFLTRTFPFSRLTLIYTWILSIIFISVGRLLIRIIQNFTLKAGIGKKRMLFVGHNTITGKLYDTLKKDKHYELVGTIDRQKNSKFPQLNFLGSVDHLEKLIKKHEIDEIIQTKSDLSREQESEIVNLCREYHVNFSFVPNLLELQQSNIETETLAKIPVIKFKPTPLDGWGKVTKRIFDIIMASIGSIILSPIFLFTAIMIKLDSKGTIFFKYLDDGSRVKRIGEHGKPFHFYKFRSMYPKTHNLRYTQLAEKNTRKGSPLTKIKDDPRITRIGRILRRTSIDEFPQLMNVIKGEMSLVGPRPHLPEEVEKYQKHHKFVLTIKPGITGLAQVSGRSDLDFEEEVQFDTYYIEHWSIWLDLKILFKTVFVIFRSYEE